MVYSTGALIVSSHKLLLPSLVAAARLVTGVLYVPLTQSIGVASRSSPETKGPTSTVAVETDSTHFTASPEEYLRETSRLIRQAYFEISEVCPLLDVRFLLPAFPPPPIPSPPLPPSHPHSLPTLQYDVEVCLSPLPASEVRNSLAYQLFLCRLRASDETRLAFETLTLSPSSDAPSAEPCDRGGSSEAAESSVDAVPNSSSSSSSFQPCSDVALGGTFDNIHNGHRLLLTQSALVATNRILVGVADGPLLRSKVLPELIQPVDVRVDKVKRLLVDLKPSIVHDVVPITDVYGPTAWDKSLKCLVVTPDTARGGEKVNAERRRKGLDLLSIYTIDLVSSGEKEKGGGGGGAEEKLSSSDIRKNMLGCYREVVGFSRLSPSSGAPYLIGLTGGIACGKSSIFARLCRLGAYPIDCDKLGHEAYRPGTLAHSKLVEEFGEGILGSDGEIDRKLLGPIVFSDKSKLERLNAIVWPEIWRLVLEGVETARGGGHRVCAIEAAVMLRANWHERVHEVWVAITPEKEVVRRVMERDNLTEEAALRRMSAQPSNSEYVRHANVVFSSQWEPEYTQKQVEKAWRELQERMTVRLPGENVPHKL